MRTLPLLRFALPFGVLAALLIAGCASLEVDRLRYEIAREHPEVKIGEGLSMSFGRVSLGFARWIVGASEDDEGVLAGLVLGEVRRVRVGVFPLEGTLDTDRVTMPRRLRRLVERNGWVPLVTFREEGEAGWVIYREQGDTITDLFTVVMGEDQLVMARVSGDVGAIVQHVLQDGEHGLPSFRARVTTDDAAVEEAAVELTD